VSADHGPADAAIYLGHSSLEGPAIRAATSGTAAVDETDGSLFEQMTASDHDTPSREPMAVMGGAPTTE
jgi:hypothetical protein